MPYSGNPADSLVDRVRLNTGDIYCDTEWLEDEVYEWLLEKYNNNVNRASLDAARMILFQLARYTRERAGDIEVYGDSIFKNYRDALLEFVRNPNLSVIEAMPYAGGISKTDMKKYRTDDSTALRIEKPDCKPCGDPLDDFSCKTGC